MDAKCISKGVAATFATAVVVCMLCMGIVYICLFRPNFTRRTTPYTAKENRAYWNDPAYEERNGVDAAWFSTADRIRLAITSDDGIPLVAYYLPHEATKGIVLMLHGFHSSPLRDFASIARFYYDSGYSICLPYQRAHGESGGTYLSYGVKERGDVRRWVDELNERYGMDCDIWVHGVSMGCAAAVMASGSYDGDGGYPFNVRGIIADCGFTSPSEIIWQELKRRRIVLPALLVRLGDWYARRFAGFSLADYSTITALRTNETPLLFIHGTADRLVPVEMTLANYEVCHAPKELLLVEGATHAMSFYTDEERYRGAVLAFMERYALVR